MLFVLPRSVTVAIEVVKAFVNIVELFNDEQSVSEILRMICIHLKSFSYCNIFMLIDIKNAYQSYYSFVDNHPTSP